MNMTIKGRKLCIEVDLDADEGISKSGKNTILASTRGATAVPDGSRIVSVNLNVYCPVKG